MHFGLICHSSLMYSLRYKTVRFSDYNCFLRHGDHCNGKNYVHSEHRPPLEEDHFLHLPIAAYYAVTHTVNIILSSSCVYPGPTCNSPTDAKINLQPFWWEAKVFPQISQEIISPRTWNTSPMKHPSQMRESPQRAPFDVEEYKLDSEPLPNGQSPHPASKFSLPQLVSAISFFQW